MSNEKLIAPVFSGIYGRKLKVRKKGAEEHSGMERSDTSVMKRTMRLFFVIPAVLRRLI